MASPTTPNAPSGAADQAKAATDDAKAAASDVADDAKKAASDVADTAKDAASDLTQTAKSEAKDLAQQAKSQATEKADQAKGQAAGVLSGVAGALHDTSDSLRDRDQDAFARYADQAATQLDQFTSAVRDRSVGELLDEAERFARRDPGLFLGGAFLLGIFGARFLKASDTHTQARSSGSTMGGAGRSATMRSTSGASMGTQPAGTRTMGRTTGDPFPTRTAGGSMDRALSQPLTPGTTGGAGTTDRTTL